MRKALLTAILLAFSAVAISQEYDDNDTESDADTNAMRNAPQSVLAAATIDCTKWAEEDGIEASALTAYLLNCVNEDLEYQGYNTVTALAK